MRMLCMNDDTHEDFYVDETGKRYNTALELLRALPSIPNKDEFVVKVVYLPDLEDCNNEGCTVSAVQAFDEVAEYDSDDSDVSFNNFKESFNVLWDSVLPEEE